MGLTHGGVFENWEIAVAKKLVDQFKRKWKCFSKDDFDDLLQECLSHWYFVRKKYEVSKGASKSTYMSNVIKNKLMDMVAERCRRVGLMHKGKLLRCDTPDKIKKECNVKTLEVAFIEIINEYEGRKP